jgi:hypothetical protein
MQIWSTVCSKRCDRPSGPRNDVLTPSAAWAEKQAAAFGVSEEIAG